MPAWPASLDVTLSGRAGRSPCACALIEKTKAHFDAASVAALRVTALDVPFFVTARLAQRSPIG